MTLILLLFPPLIWGRREPWCRRGHIQRDPSGKCGVKNVRSFGAPCQSCKCPTESFFYFWSFSFAFFFFLWLCFLPELSCGVVRYFFWMYWPCLSCSRLCGLQSLVLGLSQRSVNYPKSKCWNPNLQCDSLRRWGPWEVIRS